MQVLVQDHRTILCSRLYEDVMQDMSSRHNIIVSEPSRGALSVSRCVVLVAQNIFWILSPRGFSDTQYLIPPESEPSVSSSRLYDTDKAHPEGVFVERLRCGCWWFPSFASDTFLKANRCRTQCARLKLFDALRLSALVLVMCWMST
jgi:hypothetical protein